MSKEQSMSMRAVLRSMNVHEGRGWIWDGCWISEDVPSVRGGRVTAQWADSGQVLGERGNTSHLPCYWYKHLASSHPAHCSLWWGGRENNNISWWMDNFIFRGCPSIPQSEEKTLRWIYIQKCTMYILTCVTFLYFSRVLWIMLIPGIVCRPQHYCDKHRE